MPVDPNRAKSLFLAALELPAHERAAFLEAQCGADEELRRRIESMLRADEASGELLPRPAAELLASEAPTAAFDPQTAPPGSANDAAQQEDVLACLDPSTRPGTLGRLGHYEIQEVVGRGGFGTVFKAFDEKLHRVVAIKVLSPAFAANGTARQRFTREARTAAAVKNEHVVGIYAVEEGAQLPYLVMEMIEGLSLQDKLDKHGPLGLKEILRIGLQMAEGLAAAHKQGLVHRDIKPANILLENGVERVKITDFSLARAVDDASVTQSGTVAGTPMYMSPEQAEGLPVDHRSDLFSLGTVLYAMCTGHPPFRASGTHAVLKRVIDAAPRPIREINNEIPDWLCAIIARLHAKKPAERFQTAKEVADILERHLAHLQQPGQAPLPPPVTRPAGPSVETDDPVVAAALAQVRTPAIGLFVTGILYWVGIPVAFWIGLDEWLVGNHGSYLWWALGVLPTLSGFVLILGGWQMKGLEWYRWSLAAACLPLLLLAEKLVALSLHQFALVPGDIVALPFGMWALFVLTRREVRQGFARVGARGARHEEAPATDQATRPLPRLGSRKRRWILKEAAALVLLVAAAVAITEFSGLTTFFRGSSARYPVTLEMDDPDIVVRIWPTAQTEPPANLAGPFEILGKPAYTIQNVTSKEVSLPAGNYWLAAELDEQEVHRVFVKVQADSLHVNYQDKFGPTMSWVGREIRGLPKTIAIPGAANLVQKETSKLQGAWRMVAAEMDGRPFPKKMFEEDNPRLVFAGDRVTHLKQGEVQKETGYTLNPRNKPAAMDIPNSAFFSRGKTALAIYRWEGDALRICASPLERPSDFTTTPGSERIAFVLQKERTKEDAARRRAVAPFVVLAKDAKAERQFATLAEADAECHSGDTIEIRGDGPFETDPLVLDKALTLRAGKGHRPVLVHKRPGSLLRTTAPLVLEGLEIHGEGHKEQEEILIHAIGAPLRIAHCRIMGWGKNAVWAAASPLLEVRHSEMVARGWAAVNWDPTSGGKLVVRNCLVVGWGAVWLHHRKPAEDATVELTGNTFVSNCFCGNRFYQDPVDADQKKAAHRVRITATRNVAHASQYFCFGEYVRGRTHPLETLTDWYRDHITWEGRDNLLPVDQLDSFLYFRQHDLTGKGEARRWKTLQDWQAFWKSSKVLGSQGTPRFVGGDLLDRVSSKEEKIAPADFRLEKGSPGEGLGGDVDRVGPGAAYEQWKQTPEYPEWRNKNDALLAGGH